MSKDNQQSFTIEQLAQRWNCSVDEVKGYIKSGELRAALDTTKAEFAFLRGLNYYKCKASARLLSAIENGKPLSEFVNPVIQEKIIPCPDHLYVPAEESAIVEQTDKDHRMFRYFYHFDGDALIPIDKNNTKFSIVKH